MACRLSRLAWALGARAEVVGGRLLPVPRFIAYFVCLYLVFADVALRGAPASIAGMQQVQVAPRSRE